MKSFPKLPNGVNVKSFSNSNHSKAEADGNDQSMASATDLFKSMTINEIGYAQHCYANESYLLDKTINNLDKALQRSKCLRLLRRQIIKAFTAIKAKLIKVRLAQFLFNQGRAIQMIKVKVDAGVKFGFRTDWHPGIGCHRNDRLEEQKPIIIIKGIM